MVLRWLLLILVFLKKNLLMAEVASPCDPRVLPQWEVHHVFRQEDDLKQNWHSWGLGEVSTGSRWYVDHDVLKLKSGAKGEELVLNGYYENFVFVFEYAVTPGANSGVKYNVEEYIGKSIGFEYQILDDALHPDALWGNGFNRRNAGLYDLMETTQVFDALTPKEFQKGCISFVDGRGEHWLNEELVLSFDTKDKTMVERVKQSKFKNVQDFLKQKSGQIFLQDHGDEIWFRNIWVARLQ